MLEKTYNPKDFENTIYERWEHKEDAHGCTVFQPAMDNPENAGKFTKKEDNFSIVIPPAAQSSPKNILFTIILLLDRCKV